MNHTETRKGYRGYVASRPIRGTSYPQRVQNLVIRDCASRKGLRYLLSATEYAMPSCFLMLNAILEDLPKIEGVIMFSIFMLPERRQRRLDIFKRVLDAGCELHFALENLRLGGREEIADLEDLLQATFTLSLLPLSGRYEKSEGSARERACDPFWSTLLRDL